jgi:glycosyltransferase involved in cell wall biosynthesis
MVEPMRLSIVVPVYNVAPYLARCLESLLVQELKPEDYEIIVINDGSTDDSEAIARKYLQKSPNIKLLNQENRGLSAARNRGIVSSKGRYIQFVDSDDYLEPDVMRHLLDKMDCEGLDILRFGYQNVNEQYHVIQPYKYPKYNDDYTDSVTDGTTFLGERMGIACYACQFIFRADHLKQEGNLFRPGIFYEDTEWTPRILAQAKRITSVNQVVYNYLLRNNSITLNRDTEKQKKLVADSLDCIDSVEALSKKYDDERLRVWTKRMIAHLYISLLKYTARNLPQEIPGVIRELKRKKHLPLSMKKQPPNQKRNVAIVNISPALFCYVMILISRYRQRNSACPVPLDDFNLEIG